MCIPLSVDCQCAVKVNVSKVALKVILVNAARQYGLLAVRKLKGLGAWA